MVKTLFVALLFMCVTLGTPGVSSGAATQRVVRLVSLFGYAPYCFTIPAHQSISGEQLKPGEDSLYFSGYSWDVMREAFHGAGYTIELYVLPWKRGYRAIQLGEYDMLFPATKTPSREMIFDFGAVPVNDSRALFYVRKDSPMRWEGLDKLPYMSVGVQRGFSYGDEWDALSPEDVRKYEVDSIRLGFAMLLSGRLDAFAGYEANWDFVARRMEITDKLRKLPVFHNGREYAIIPKKATQAREALDVLNERMQEMDDNGRLAVLREKWELPPLD